MTTARGIRNRNPGNIVVSGWTQRQDGYLGPEPEGRFAKFDTMAHGVQALMRLLMVYRDQHKLKTVRSIINRWAPSVENDTSSYVLAVSRAVGVEPDDELPANAETYAGLARAIVQHENGRDQAIAVTEQDYSEAASAVFMQAASATPQPAPPPTAPTQPAPTLGESVMAIPALVLAAGQALLPVVIDLFRKRGSKTADRNADIVESAKDALPVLVEIGKQLVPGANEQQVAETILASKPLQEQFRAAVALQWKDIEPFMQFEEESREKARGFAETMTGSGPTWRQIGAGLLLAVLSLVIVGGAGWIFYQVLFAPDSTFSPSTRDGIVEVIKNILVLVVGFFFGSSASGRQAGETVSQIAKGK